MDIDITQLPGILRRRPHYLVGSVVACLLLALAYALHLTPMYSSSAQIILDPKSLSADGGSVASALSAPQQDQSSLESQIYVVRSRAVLDKVVEKLDLTKDTFLLAPAARQKLSPADAIAATAGALTTHLTVERAGQSLVLVVSAKHPDAQRAADIANAVAETYLNQIDESRAEAAQKASAAFQTQADELRDRVLKAEIAVEQFKAENGLATTGSSGLVIDQQLAGLNQQLIAARGLEEQQQTIYEQAQRLTMDALKTGGIPEALQSQTIGLLRDRYVQLLDRQTQLETNLGANHPQLRAIRSQVANMQQALEQELARLRQSMQSSYQRAAANTKALQERLEAMTQGSFNTGTAQIKLRQLESQAETVRTLYKAFLNRAEELGQQQELKTNNSRIITVATPSGGTSRLVTLVILAAGGTFGLVFGAALAVGREILDRTFFVAAAREADEAELPVIATLPGLHPPPSSKPWFFFRQAQVSAPANARKLWDEGIAAVARTLERDLDGREPATFLFVAAEKLQHSAAHVIPDVVQALVDLGYEVRYAPGSWDVERQAQKSPAGRPSLVSAIGRERSNALPTASERLRYQYFSDTAGRQQAAGRPHFSRYMGTSLDNETITVINACGTEAASSLATLASTSSAIIVVRDASQDISAILERLDPWRDIMLGQVVVGDGS
jgi:Uncharacterized protein involved in exopolysaccharide biosynthesis